MAHTTHPVIDESPSPVLPRKAFIVRIFALAAFIGPLSYVASILSVVLHEVVGHGLVARVFGGTFSEFAVFPDAYGWAACNCDQHPIAFLAGGMVVTTTVGLMLLIVGALVPRRPLTRLGLLVFTIMLLSEGLPYAFWNAVFPRPPGDMGRILIALDAGWGMRYGLILACGMGWIAGTLVALLLMWRSLEAILGRLDFARAVFVSAFFVAAPGIAYWGTFDWNQLIDGVGQIPAVLGACVYVATPVPLVLKRADDVVPLTIRRSRWITVIATSWVVCAALLVILFTRLRYGVAI